MNIETTFEASYARLIGSGVGIAGEGVAFFARFYERFLESSAEVHEKFRHTDMNRQGQVMQKGLYQLMIFYLTKCDNDFLEDIATSHDSAHYDITPELYDLWLDTLLATVEELDPDYNPDVGLAWKIVLYPGILYMKHHWARSQSGVAARHE